MRIEASCIVLAGGKSSRLGRDKVLERIGDSTLLERTIEQLIPMGREIILVGANGSALRQISRFPGIRAVADVLPGKGPIGGLYTGLSASRTQHNLVVGCDTPFLNLDLLDYLLEISDDYDAVVPRIGRLVEPLQAAYSKSCLPAISANIEAGKLKIFDLYSVIRVKYVEEAEIDRFDPDHRCFLNINTEADLTEAKKILHERARQSAQR